MPTDSYHFPCTFDTLVRPQFSLARKALSATRGLARGGVRHLPENATIFILQFLAIFWLVSAVLFFFLGGVLALLYGRPLALIGLSSVSWVVTHCSCSVVPCVVRNEDPPHPPKKKETPNFRISRFETQQVCDCTFLGR